jgi:hypothetical protein
VTVPTGRAGEAVFASVDGAQAQGIEKLRAFVYRAAIRHVNLGESRARLVARNAVDGLLLAAPPKADFPAPFALAPNVETISVDSTGGFATSSGPLEISFFAVPIAPARAP